MQPSFPTVYASGLEIPLISAQGLVKVCRAASRSAYILIPEFAGQHQLSQEQIYYSNQLFIYLIQFLPFTPMTNQLCQRFPVIPSFFLTTSDVYILLFRDWLEQSFNTPALQFPLPSGAISYGYNPLNKTATFPDQFNGVREK